MPNAETAKFMIIMSAAIRYQRIHAMLAFLSKRNEQLGCCYMKTQLNNTSQTMLWRAKLFPKQILYNWKIYSQALPRKPGIALHCMFGTRHNPNFAPSPVGDINLQNFLDKGDHRVKKDENKCIKIEVC